MESKLAKTRGNITVEELLEINKRLRGELGELKSILKAVEVTREVQKRKDEKIKELEGEVKRLERLRVKDCNFYNEENKTLTAQLELLTRCEYGGACKITDLEGEDCQGCKNMAVRALDKLGLEHGYTS